MRVRVGSSALLMCLLSSQPLDVLAEAAALLPQKEQRRIVEEVIVSGLKRQDTTVIGEETKQLFGVAGAADDPLQAVYSLPGVTFSSGGEPVIRGSAPQDNAYYIDLVPAQYLFHVFGNSIFNKNLIQRFDLYPAAFPGRYANATGGVIDVTLRDPRHQPFETTITGSFLLTGIMVEGALSENQAFYASYRRSLLDQFNGEDLTESEDGVDVTEFPVAQDYQFKYRWDLNDKNSLSFVAAGASDDLEAEVDEENDHVARDPDLAGPVSYDQGFDSQGLIWAWASDSSEKESNLMVSHISDYLDLDYGVEQKINTPADRYIYRFDYGQAISWLHHLTFGVSHEKAAHKVDVEAKIAVCSDFDADCSTADAEFIYIDREIDIDTTIAYVEDEIRLNDRQLLNIGAHVAKYDYLDETRFEPRLKWEYEASTNRTFSVAAGLYSQMPELAQMVEGVGNPNLDSIKSEHFVLGFNEDFATNWRLSAEMYYKNLHDVVISIRDPNAADASQKYSNDAEGRAYGVELMLNRRLSNKWYGWAALSLGKTERTDLRSGERSPFEYDKPVIFNIVANYILSERWNIGFKWTYQSGALYTPVVDLEANDNDGETPSLVELLLANPAGGLLGAISDLLDQVNIIGAPSPVYGSYNSERLPDYHRLDFRAEYTKPKDWGYWRFYVDVLNVYDQKNVESYEYSPNDREPLSYTPSGFGDNVPVAAEHAIGLFPSLGFEVQF